MNIHKNNWDHFDFDCVCCDTAIEIAVEAIRKMIPLWMDHMRRLPKPEEIKRAFNDAIKRKIDDDSFYPSSSSASSSSIRKEIFNDAIKRKIDEKFCCPFCGRQIESDPFPHCVFLVMNRHTCPGFGMDADGRDCEYRDTNGKCHSADRMTKVLVQNPTDS